MIPQRKRMAVLIGSLVALGHGMRDVSANDDTSRLGLKLTEEWNDNVQLVANPQRNVLLSSLSGFGEFNSRQESRSASLRGQVNLNRYNGASYLNGTDLLLNGALGQEYERDSLALLVDLVRDSTLSSELTETGLLQANSKRTRIGLKPKWSWKATERVTLNLGHEFNDVRYDNSSSANLVDYRTLNSAGSVDYAITQTTTGSLTAGLSDLRLKSRSGQIRTTYIQAGITHTPSPRNKFDFAVGLRRTQDSSRTASSTDTGWLGLASAQRDYERMRVVVGISREVNPTGSGDLTQTDKVFTALSGAITERLSWNLDAAIYKNKGATAFSNNTSEKYYKIGGVLNYRLTEDLRLEAGVARAQRDPNSGASATSNSINLAIRYEFQH